MAFQQYLADGEAAVARIRPLHHDPRRLGGAGLAQGMLRNLAELVVDLEARPVELGHTPARLGILLQRLQAFFLRVLGQVEPELEDQRAFVGEHLLEAVDLLDVLVERRRAGLLQHALHDGRGVPGTEEHADLALGRQRAPEAPHRGTLALLVRHFAHGVRLDVARIHPLVEQVHRLALARAIHAADQDDDREFAFLRQIELRVQQRPRAVSALPCRRLLCLSCVRVRQIQT